MPAECGLRLVRTASPASTIRKRIIRASLLTRPLTVYPAMASRASLKTSWDECTSALHAVWISSTCRLNMSGIYTKADGLPSSAVTVAFRDRQDALWFGTDLGLSRLIPGPDSPQQQPPILISGLRIAGDSQPISALGESEVSGLILNPNQNQLSIDFVGLGFAAGEGLKYQYKLIGANEEWSAPTDQRTINYAGLSPGKYRFMVQAVTADGITSPSPATISFTIMPPFWQRWWFVILTLALTGLVAAAIIRNRVTRLIELERVRTRIAADLHDDIGSALSRIAILSEVTRRQGNVEAAVSEPLGVIAGASRDLVDSMSDIVWAINPNKDHLRDLIQRMRRFASDLFTARQIEFSFDAPGEEQAFENRSGPAPPGLSDFQRGRQQHRASLPVHASADRNANRKEMADGESCG